MVMLIKYDGPPYSLAKQRDCLHLPSTKSSILNRRSFDRYGPCQKWPHFDTRYLAANKCLTEPIRLVNPTDDDPRH